MNNETETAPKKQVNKWKWSTIIVSVISVVTISFMGFALFNQNQAGMNGPGNMSSNNQSQMGGTDESYGMPPSGGPNSQQGGTSDSSGDTDANSGASMNPDTDSSTSSSSNSI